MTSSRRNRRGLAWVSVLIAVAAALRTIGLAYGLPAVYNPDEVAIMNRALGLTQTALNPHNFLYPTFYFYVLLAWEGLGFVAGRLLGIYDSLAAFETGYFVDPSWVYLVGRTLTVACGAATVWAVYRLGRTLFGSAAGWGAACLLAVAPLAVRDAHYVKHDVPVTLLIVLTYVVLAGDLVNPARGRKGLLAGALAGLAMSTHYYAVFLAVPVALGAVQPRVAGEPMGPRLHRLAVAGIACAAAFFAASPFLLVEPLAAVRDIVANREIVVDRATEATGAFGSLAFYGRWLFRDAMGTSACVLAIAGIGAAAFTDWRRLGFVLVFPVLFLLFIANTFPASRYLNPVLPFLAVLGGVAVASLSRHGRLGAVAAGAVLTVAVVEGGLASVRTDHFLRQTDTRTQALGWIQQNVQADASILVQPYSVPLPVSRAALEDALTASLGSPDRASVRFRRQLELAPLATPAYRTIYLGDGGLDVDKIYVSPSAFHSETGLTPLRRLGVAWVVMKRYNEPDPAMSSLDAALAREGRLVATFSPYAPAAGVAAEQRTPPFLHNTDTRIRPELERPGPIIEIWTID